MSVVCSGVDLKPMPATDLARLKARTVCSCLFVQRMSFRQCADGSASIWRFGLPGAKPPLIESPTQRFEMEYDGAVSTVSFRDGNRVLARSQYLPDGGGCVALDPEAKRGAAKQVNALAVSKESSALPRGAIPSDADAQAVTAALNEGFSAAGPMKGFARAAVVISRDRVVADRYAPGFGPQNQYYLGSVTKVFNNLLAGLLVRDGKLRVTDTVSVPEWPSPADPRSRITYDQLLKFVGGLSWEEEFFVPGAPAYSVYFEGGNSFDVARFMRSRTLEAPPGTHYEYSTGSATLLASLLQARLPEPGRASLLNYLRTELFDPIGAQQITPGFDAAGTFLSGHAAFAGAEDLSRMGMLLLHNGRAQGRQILPEGWVAYSLKPALAEEPGYGAQLMTNVIDIPGCFGHAGVGAQLLVVCPSRSLVIVWLSSVYNFTGNGPSGPKASVQKIVRAFPSRP